MFRDQYRGLVRSQWLGDQQEWLFWNGKRWQRSALSRVRELAKDIARLVLVDIENAIAGKDEKDRSAENKARLSWTRRLRNDPFKMTKIAESDPALCIEAETLDADKHLFNCQSGVIDLKAGLLLPHSPDYLITMISPVEFDESAQCPKWLKMLDQIFEGDTDLISFIQKVLGKALRGDGSDHFFPIWYGSGANGKSVVQDILLHIAGDYGAAVRSESLMVKRSDQIPNEVMQLKGKRIVFAPEGAEARLMDSALVKQISAGDPISGRFLHKEFQTFKPQCVLTLITNHLPKMNGADNALLRRLAVIPFAFVVPANERDPHLKEKLMGEASGILNWLIQGALTNGPIERPKAVLIANGTYAKEHDQVAQFIEERCVSEQGARESSSSLYSAFRVWQMSVVNTFTSSNTISSKQAFGRSMVLKLGASKKDSYGNMYFMDIRLRT